ncbi:thiol-disulfide oxidoreductase DCC family protein [Taibaiella chishuiensis]|uniref:Putative DCC family thiol-disulfide oxidoreductase YuxK n=1 Tax=Taibaiella chishuiensis TaxID=1434707 RepID=A0A2P8CW71_9BACT|nr:thiol-disulfide oxidoreductase DCC family protein [Taibaiella chishuiensis]PSK89221.1 putative DCC family thiol-disulfide oxidoreductase YuxK [Taibaiella chishuiensis]
MIVPEDKLIVLFDGVCNLCNRSVQFIIRHDPKGAFLFAPLQSDTGKALLAQLPVALPGTPDSIILVAKDRVWRFSDAVLQIARRLDGAWPLAYAAVVVPRFIRNPIYRFIARNRYRWFGRQDHCMLPTAALKARFLE